MLFIFRPTLGHCTFPKIASTVPDCSTPIEHCYLHLFMPFRYKSELCNSGIRSIICKLIHLNIKLWYRLLINLMLATYSWGCQHLGLKFFCQVDRKLLLIFWFINNNLSKLALIMPIPKSWSTLCQCACFDISGEISWLNLRYRLLRNQKVGLYIQKMPQSISSKKW